MIKPIAFTNVSINDGFWKKRQEINNNDTIYAIYNQFKDTQRFESLKHQYKEGDPIKPHYFWDSDIAKWIESAGYILSLKKDVVLEKLCDELIDDIHANQLANGYFNTYFTVVEPEKVWTNRIAHELYCAGHLMEAAVAYYTATGKDKLLNVMCRYADYIQKVFVIEDSAAFVTPGHPEIELALVKLYLCTNEKKYLELSKFFIDSRGTSGDKDNSHYGFANNRYDQSHIPLREQTTAQGHSVRAAYIYAGMADIAYHCDDDALKKACEAIFNNIIEKRMYITGGIGSAIAGEAFTYDYDLPNLVAYAESCAAIALIFFAERMLLLDNDSKYSNIIEQVLYNAFLSNISLDGKSFFYTNPLEINLAILQRDTSQTKQSAHYPDVLRSEVFECSCCPPNISRLYASLGNYLYTSDEDTLYIHQYMSNKTTFEFNNKTVNLSQTTTYPLNSDISINITNMSNKKIAFRIPHWCEKYSIKKDDIEIDVTIEKGYGIISCDSDDFTLNLNFEMDTYLVESNPNVTENSGKVALFHGPVLYCIESIDNNDIRSIVLERPLSVQLKYDDLFKYYTITAKAKRKSTFASLYQKESVSYEYDEIKLIPYYGFANRGKSDMLVWMM